MARIKVLPPLLRNKIAAGEVIERPASVVKELLENSIDAGSTDIRVDVLYGGKRSMKVSDNGVGMDNEDALLCIERHATSKLLSEDDLFDIRTLGFRGEALPSIASVSKMKIITAPSGASHGLSVEIEGGEVRTVKDSPSSGTSVEVKDLFFNTPARKKFLKTNTTELFHIMDTVTRQAIVHYGIGFSLWTDGRETMVLPRASGIKERLLQIYGDDFLKGLLDISADDDIKMNAFFSRTEHFRNTRSHQFIFINGRPVKDLSLSHAIYKAYEGILPEGKHPLYFLFLELDPKTVDFNVHPAKKEVRFLDRESIRAFVSRNIGELIRAERKEYTNRFISQPEPGVASFERVNNEGGLNAGYSFPSDSSILCESAELPYSPAPPFLYLGETFIASSGRGGLMLIDHHAAHERILYEKFLSGISLDVSRLLFPERVRLSQREYTVVLTHRDLLSELGFEVEDFGHQTVIVRTMPEALKGADLASILSDAASGMMEGTEGNESFKKEIAAKIACHGSIRGRKILNNEEFSKLLTDLEKTEHPDQCPHGRPTRLFYSLADLKKLFGRI